jgi:hypothetical protein
VSWLSVAWTRAKGTVANVASAVPVVGGVIASAVNNIHTGDEHLDPVTGQWVRNSDGSVVVAPPSAALQAQIDATNAFNQAELNRVRQQLADLAAKGGVAAASAIGPQGNIYQQLVATASQNPLLTFAAVLMVGGVIYMAVSD